MTSFAQCVKMTTEGEGWQRAWAGLVSPLYSFMDIFHYWGCFKAKILPEHQFGNLGTVLID